MADSLNNGTNHEPTNGRANETALTPMGRAWCDVRAGVVVFFVALPLCLGIALASNAPPIAGLLAGIIGGLVVGLLSGSHTSVSGPAAGLATIVYGYIAMFQGQYGKERGFEIFLMAVVLAGVIQIALGVARAGCLSAFVPSSVIKGLLAAIGVLLILKQFPHVFGHDADPEGEMSFFQLDQENTFSEILKTFPHIHLGAAVIGIGAIALLILWDRIKLLKKSVIPAPLLVVLLGVGLNLLFQRWGGAWDLSRDDHLVNVPIAKSPLDFVSLLRFPAFSEWLLRDVWMAAVTLAAVATLETLLNLEAVDKLDPEQRASPPSRELVAQGIGNVCAGLVGGIPITSVIVRSSVNINAGARTKTSAVLHGFLLLTSVVFFPSLLNYIPLSSLAAILLVTGIKLASPKLALNMWREGPYQFIPFVITLVAIILTDLIVGVLIGLAVSASFILYSNLRRPIRRVVEKHLGGDVLHIELANQVSFLNKAALDKVLREVPRGSQVLLDAENTDYIDPDILSLIREFRETIAPAHGIKVSLRGFRKKYQLHDEVQFADYSTRELQEKMTPSQVLMLLQEGNERFRTGRRLVRNLGHQFSRSAQGQNPLAVVLSCIDSRAPTEIVFDVGLGDIFSIRVAGNIICNEVLGSMEYACAVAGAKLVLVMGHSCCGAVRAAVEHTCSGSHTPIDEATGCQHIGPIVDVIKLSMDTATCNRLTQVSPELRSEMVDSVSRRNVLHQVQAILDQSTTIRTLVEQGRVALFGGFYDVSSGKIQFIVENMAESLVARQ